MKKSLTLYLIILLVLVNLFTYMFLSKQVKFEQTNYDKLSAHYTKMKDSLLIRLSDADYFSLENNQNAQDYFENKTTGTFIAPEKLIPFVKDKLIDFNESPNGNPYTGFELLNGKKFIINKVKVLNHRWVIADFNNGEIWGEAIIKYFINDDGTVSFELAETIVYPKQ